MIPFHSESREELTAKITQDEADAEAGLVVVKLTKLTAQNTPEGALPLEYWLKGILLNPITVGRPVKVWRTARARQKPEEPEIVECLGLFETTPVTAVSRDGRRITTRNSTWEMEVLPVEEVAK